MKKALKTILITLIVIFATAFLFIDYVCAQSPNNLVVQFEQTPLFKETNFFPGASVTRWVKVTNNSSQTQKISIKATNVNDADRLGNVLNLEIKNATTTLYKNSLSNFFKAGEVYLSDVGGNGGQTQYDFTVTFDPTAGNEFQGKSLRFDLVIQGTETETKTETRVTTFAALGGGGQKALLTIQEESVIVTNIQETSVTITWTTSYLSTSQVIYAKAGENHTLDLTDNVGVPPYPPKYGYARTTLEYDTSPRVTFHSVTIFGLEPGTTYYFRTVSHGSLAISREYTFTTKGVAGITTEKPKGEGVSERGEVTETPSAPEVVEVSPTPSPSMEEGKPQISGEVKKEGLGSLLLASLSLIGNTPWMIVALVLIVCGIVYIGIVEWKRRKKKQ